MRPGQKRDPEPGTMNAVKNFLMKALADGKELTIGDVKKKFKLTAKEVKALKVRIDFDEEKGTIIKYNPKPQTDHRPSGCADESIRQSIPCPCRWAP